MIRRLLAALVADLARALFALPGRLLPAPRACSGHFCPACGWPTALAGAA